MFSEVAFHNSSVSGTNFLQLGSEATYLNPIVSGTNVLQLG